MSSNGYRSSLQLAKITYHFNPFIGEPVNHLLIMDYRTKSDYLSVFPVRFLNQVDRPSYPEAKTNFTRFFKVSGFASASGPAAAANPEAAAMDKNVLRVVTMTVLLSSHYK